MIHCYRFRHVSVFLKQQSVGHRPKKFKVFTLEEMQRFLDDGSDDEYLLQKVIFIVGIFGGRRIGELVALSVSDIEDRGRVLMVQIPGTKTHKPSHLPSSMEVTLFLLLTFFGSTEYYGLKRFHTSGYSSFTKTKNVRYTLQKKMCGTFCWSKQFFNKFQQICTVSRPSKSKRIDWRQFQAFECNSTSRL